MRKGFAALLIGAGLVALSGTAAAQSHGGMSIFFGVPAPVYVQAPDVHHPPPGYYAPPPVYYDASRSHAESRAHYRPQREHHDRQPRRGYDHH